MPAPWARGAELRVIGEIHGSQTVNVWHLATNEVIDDDPDNLDDVLLQLATAMLQCIVEQLLPAVTIDWRIDRCEAKYIYPFASDPIVATANTGSVGQLSPASASFEAVLVNLRTGGGGKSGRGKKFLPPPGEQGVAASLVDPGVLLDIIAFLTCVAGKFTGANPSTFWRLGVLSQKILNQTLGGGFDNAFRLVTQMTPSSNLSLLSSRKKGTGS